MISEMLRTSRWFYVQEPVWPPGPRRRNSWYKKRALYAKIIVVVKDSPGISTGDVARKLGRPYAYISPLLFHLKRFESLRYEPAGVERTQSRPGPQFPIPAGASLSHEAARFRKSKWGFGLGMFSPTTAIFRYQYSLSPCTIEAYIWGWWKGFPAPSSGGKTGSFT